MIKLWCKTRQFHGLASLLFMLMAIPAVYAHTTSGNSTTGQTLYNSNCTGCRGVTVASIRPAIKNAANAGGIINIAMSNGMGSNNTGSFSSGASRGSVSFSTSGTSLRSTYAPDTGQCGADTVNHRATNGGAITSTNALLPAAVSANAPSTSSVAKRSTPYPTVHPLPPMDPRKVLSLPALKAAMRHGGLVFYLRHTENGVITPQCESSNLTPRGEADARQIGKAIRDLKLPIGKIFSSDICRVRDTARLLDLGAFEITEDLTNMPKREGHDIHTARMKLLATVPPAGTHHLLVSHIHGGDREDQAIYLDLGEIIVYRPNGRGGADAVARIRIEDWQNYPAAGNTGTDLPTR